MNKIKTISNSHNPNLEIYSKEEIYLHVDFFTDIKKDAINILWLCEPDVISGLKSSLDKYAHNYKYIFTFDVEVLEKYSHAVKLMQGYPWIREDREYGPKSFSVSTVVGNKVWTKNHELRQKLWFKQEKITNIEREFYMGFYGGPENFLNNKILEGGQKHQMFYSQFHICIENCSIQNYFSEKILDCFISKTIPIYCGCLNIGEYFNEKGILRFTNIKECIEVCNSLTPSVYNEMLPYIEENYKLAQDFLVIEQQLVKTFKNTNIDVTWKQ